MKQVASMKYLFIILLICFTNTTSFASNQVVAGLSISFPDKIQYNKTRSEQFFRKVPQDIISNISSFEIYENNNFSIYKTTYNSGVAYSLDVGASGAISNELGLRKTNNVKKSIQSLKVSGFDARRISITYDVQGGKMASETLLIYDSATGRLWMIMFALSKRQPLNPFASYNLDVERADVSAILNSVGVIR